MLLLLFLVKKNNKRHLNLQAMKAAETGIKSQFSVASKQLMLYYHLPRGKK